MNMPQIMNAKPILWVVLLLALGLAPLDSRAVTSVPNGLPARLKADLTARYQQLAQQHDALNQRINNFNVTYQDVPEGSTLAQQAVTEQAGIDADKARYRRATDAYEADLAAAVKQTLEALNGQIATTRIQLSRATQQLQGFQSSADEWINLGEDARQKARISARDTVASVLLAKLSASNESQTELDETSLKKIGQLLRNRVFMDDLYAQVLTAQHLDALKTDADVIKTLENVRGVVDLSGSNLNDREEVLKAVLKGIELVDRDPRVALLIADGDITIDSAYGWLAAQEARNRVNQLLDLSGDQLKAVTVLSNLYEKEIKNRNSLMAALQK